MDNRQPTRRTLLAGVSAGLTLALAGCSSDGSAADDNDVQDSDGDGVVDSEDYAPRDPAVQRESDVQSGGGTAGSTENGGSAGSSTDSQPQTTTEVTYPSYSGAHSISARENFWAWEFSVAAEFSLTYRAINQRDENYDFDMLLYPPSEFEEYRALANEVREGIRPQYIDGSAPDVNSGVEVTDIRLPAGTYYLVIDNTDLSDAGDWGTEDTRRVRLEATTTSV